MDTKVLEKQFARMGARLKVNVRPTIRRSRFTGFAVDIGRDGHGPFFDVALGEEAERDLEVLDIQPGQRHLLCSSVSPTAAARQSTSSSAATTSGTGSLRLCRRRRAWPPSAPPWKP